MLDEPTSALDPATAAALLADIARLREDGGPAVLLVGHDLAQVASIADEVAVLDAGRLVERGPVMEVVARPVSVTARRLVAAARPVVPSGPPKAADGVPSLELRGLEARHGARSVLTAIDLSVDPGGCLSVVGPSGGGKTTLLRCLTGLHADWSGHLRLAGEELPHGDDVAPSIHRVAYDALAVAREMRAAGLPAELAAKLVAAA